VLLPVNTKVPAPIFSSGRGPLSSEITPACVAEPIVTCSWVALLLTTIGLAMVQTVHPGYLAACAAPGACSMAPHIVAREARIYLRS
jgi:hypothetical protein